MWPTFWLLRQVAQVAPSTSKNYFNLPAGVRPWSDSQLKGDALFELAQKGYLTIPKASLLLEIHLQTLYRRLRLDSTDSLKLGSRNIMTEEQILSALQEDDDLPRNTGRNLLRKTKRQLKYFREKLQQAETGGEAFTVENVVSILNSDD